MIQLIQETIYEKFPDLAGSVDTPLSFLKYSTPNSGKTLNDKVIFLVFRPRAIEPFLCAKTVRSYSAKETVVRNFNNLKKLNMLTAGSPHARLFAEALYLYDDGENIFSIETACPGRRIKLDEKKLMAVVAGYTDFQEYVAKRTSEPLLYIEQFAEEIVRRSGCKEPDQQKLLQFIATLPSAGIKLPRLIQHGDVTEDNILMSDEGFCIVDCDFVGVTDLPGFDLYGLFYRLNRRGAKRLCDEYFPEYFKRIGADTAGKGYEGLLFLYNIIERTRKSDGVRDASAEEIISDFRNVYY